ncbi:MAG: ABC transporter permease [Flavobacteriales bacterium]|nr:ABC transporter permease [Flavobacteriales bacterium]
MSKISLIIQREYLVRVKKKSFLIMSIVGPLLIAALMIVPAWLATNEEDSQLVEVIDESGLFINELKNTEEVSFEHTFRSLKDAQNDLNNKGDYTAVLHIPKVIVSLPQTAQIFYKDKPKGSSIRYMEEQIAKTIENKKLEDLYNLSVDQISGLRPKVRIVSNKITEDGKSEESADSLATGVGLVLAMFIYFFIFLFGVQVMRGVIEEKTNRIIEVIISSVKPFELMMGKIIGIALVALTQVALWIVLSTAFVTIAQSAFSDEIRDVKTEQVKQLEEFNPEKGDNDVVKSEKNIFAELNYKLSLINFPLVIGCFIFYFLGGYLFYGSLFAAIGSAVDNETDTQQFMMPVTMPLIVSIVIAQVVMDNPDGSLAFWASIIPFTSPIVMMVRIPFGVAGWEVALSMVILVATFIGSTMMAGKIYRTGILMYGKKINFKEIGKWLFYKG